MLKLRVSTHLFVLLVLCKWRHIRPLVSMYAYIALCSLLLLLYGCILNTGNKGAILLLMQVDTAGVSDVGR